MAITRMAALNVKRISRLTPEGRDKVRAWLQDVRSWLNNVDLATLNDDYHRVLECEETTHYKSVAAENVDS